VLVTQLVLVLTAPFLLWKRRNYLPFDTSGTREDPATWNTSCTSRDVVIDEIEPLPDSHNDYRAVAQNFLRMLIQADTFMSKSEDARLAWVCVAIAFRLTSVRNLSLTEIASQLGVSTRVLSRKTAQARAVIGLADGARLPVLADQATSPRL
jgi:hypothetical protein